MPAEECRVSMREIRGKDCACVPDELMRKMALQLADNAMADDHPVGAMFTALFDITLCGDDGQGYRYEIEIELHRIEN